MSAPQIVQETDFIGGGRLGFTPRLGCSDAATIRPKHALAVEVFLLGLIQTDDSFY